MSLGLALAPSGLAQTTPGEITITAKPAPTPLPAPDGQYFGFEPTFTPGQPYGPWTLSDATVEDGTFSLLDAPVLEGSQFLAMESGGSASADFQFPHAGTWRLTFRAAKGAVAPLDEAAQLRVRVDGNQVLLTSPSSTNAFLEQFTRTFESGSGTSTKEITIEVLGPPGHWHLFDAFHLEQIRPWSKSRTWTTHLVPSPGDHVVIPYGARVALDSDREAQSIYVEGELLVSEGDFDLKTRGFLLANAFPLDPNERSARFEVGQEGTPFDGDFELRLIGPKDWSHPAVTMMQFGSRFLAARDGAMIDLHGAPKQSWTFLDEVHMEAGLQVLTLEDEVDWSPGDRIVVAGYHIQEEVKLVMGVEAAGNDEAEEREVYDVDGHDVTLTAPLSIPMTGLRQEFMETFASGATADVVLDQRREVGLLSHNVRVVGDMPSVLPNHPGHGGHMVLFRQKNTDPVDKVPGGRGRFSHVELRHMGQKSIKGRYPIHWHMQLGDGYGQYFVDSSIHRCFNRAATIHGTEYVRFDRNVAFDHVGHGIFLEDGSERFNSIRGNLVATTRRPASDTQVTPTDNSHAERQNRSPASFWITNPMNYIDGNSAAGTPGTGYWFALAETPQGLSATEPYFTTNHPIDGDQMPLPFEEALGSFANNRCHSSATALDINDQIRLHAPDDDEEPTLHASTNWLPPVQAVMSNFLAWGCDTGIYTGESYGDVVFEDAVLADNGTALDFAGFQEAKRALILGDTFQGILPLGFKQWAYALYHEGKLTDSIIRGFTGNRQSVFLSSQSARRQTAHEFMDVTLDPKVGSRVNIPNFLDTDQTDQSPIYWTVSLRDLDGSIASAGGLSIIGNHPFMTVPGMQSPLPDLVFLDGPLYETPLKYGHINMQTENMLGLPVATHIPDIVLRRIDLDGNTPEVTFVYEPNLHEPPDNPRKQFPVIVDTDVGTPGESFHYECDWINSADHTLPVESRYAITLADVDPDDVLTMSLVIGTNLIVEASAKLDRTSDDPEVVIPEADKVGDLATFVETAFHYDKDKGRVTIRFTQVPHREGTTVYLTW